MTSRQTHSGRTNNELMMACNGNCSCVKRIGINFTFALVLIRLGYFWAVITKQSSMNNNLILQLLSGMSKDKILYVDDLIGND